MPCCDPLVDVGATKPPIPVAAQAKAGKSVLMNQSVYGEDVAIQVPGDLVRGHHLRLEFIGEDGFLPLTLLHFCPKPRWRPPFVFLADFPMNRLYRAIRGS